MIVPLHVHLVMVPWTVIMLKLISCSFLEVFCFWLSTRFGLVREIRNLKWKTFLLVRESNPGRMLRSPEWRPLHQLAEMVERRAQQLLQFPMSIPSIIDGWLKRTVNLQWIMNIHECKCREACNSVIVVVCSPPTQHPSGVLVSTQDFQSSNWSSLPDHADREKCFWFWISYSSTKLW